MRPGQLTPNELEMAILLRIADRHPSIKSRLSSLHVLSRTYTGVGSYTNFAQDNTAEVRAVEHLGLETAIRLPSLQYGLGAELCCEGNSPKFLEVVAYGEHRDGTFDGFVIESAP